MATLDEARTCPKCGNLMELEVASRDEARKQVNYAAICMTELCTWFGTGRAITVNNGIVFERNQGPRGQDKQFPTLSPDELAHGQRMVEDAVNRDLRDTGRPE